MSGCIVSLTASFCSIYPQYLLFLSFFILFWRIKLSPYQHQCCTVSLIASFCSINPQYLPFLSIFLHDFLVICQFEFVCVPNGMTAEPKSHGRPTKPQRKSGLEIVFRLSPGARKISGTRQLPNLEVGEYQSLIIRARAVFWPSRGGRVILCSYGVSTISKYNCHCISYNLICLFDRFLAT